MEPRGGGRAAARRRLLLLFVGLLPAAAGLWSTHGTEDSPEVHSSPERPPFPRLDPSNPAENGLIPTAFDIISPRPSLPDFRPGRSSDLPDCLLD